LRVLAGKVAPDAVRDPTVPVAAGYSYDTGLIVRGHQVLATVSIAGHASTAPIPIQLVTELGCEPTVPACPAANGGVPIAFGGQFDGILGVSLREPVGGCCVNPLWNLSGNVGQAFAVRYRPGGISTLTLGADATGFTTISLTAAPEPQPLPDPGATSIPPSWIGLVNTCYAIPNIVSAPHCVRTQFDTGTPALVLTLPEPPAGPLPPDTPVTLTAGTWSHTLTSGPGIVVRIQHPPPAATPPSPIAVAGLAVFAGTGVRFDLAHGSIGLAPI
jgi:hypothetical protein